LEAFDVAIVGAGIAGSALAYRLAPHRSVLLLEREPQPGYHSTGRSAAMFMESYGPPQARALTRASRAFYERPPEGFSETPIVTPRGVLYVGWEGQQARLDDTLLELRATGSRVERVDASTALRRVPALRAQGLLGAIEEPDAMDIDVHALHQGFLRGARSAGAVLWADAELVSARRDAGVWDLRLADGRGVRAGTLVNAAGAWADAVASLAGAPALGLEPRRRSAFTFAPPAGANTRSWPTVAAIDESWYLKPDAGQLLGSPANADPVHAHDVQPEELDIATGIARIEAATTLTIARPTRTWAGLRTFAPDGELVIGFDPRCDGFFWLAGQGGYGIQSAAGASLLALSLLLGRPLAEELIREGIVPARMSPGRL
jgi:D-arginine dehydrogenase